MVAWAGKRRAFIGTMDDKGRDGSFPQNFVFEEIFHKTLREQLIASKEGGIRCSLDTSQTVQEQFIYARLLQLF